MLRSGRNLRRVFIMFSFSYNTESNKEYAILYYYTMFDHRVKLKENKRRDKHLDLAWELKKKCETWKWRLTYTFTIPSHVTLVAQSIQLYVFVARRYVIDLTGSISAHSSNITVSQQIKKYAHIVTWISSLWKVWQNSKSLTWWSWNLVK